MTIFAFNPKRSLLRYRWARVLPVSKRLNNFGDLLGPIVVTKLLADKQIHQSAVGGCKTLFTVGSVLHFAKDNDVVWGSGRNGKIPANQHLF